MVAGVSINPTLAGVTPSSSPPGSAQPVAPQPPGSPQATSPGAAGAVGQPPRLTQPRVIVIDDFSTKVLNINRGDTVPDLSHGEACALVAEWSLGRPVERADIGDWNKDASSAARFVDHLKRLIRETHPADLSKLVLSVSLAATEGAVLGDPKMLELRNTLDWLARAGAQVFIAAGNEFDNALATPAMRTVSGSDGGVGFAPDPQASRRLIRNPETDAVRNALLVSNPVYENGQLAGFSLVGRAKVNLPLSQMTDVSARIDTIAGRKAEDARLGAPQLEALGRQMQSMSYEERMQMDLSAHADQVVSLADTRAAFKALKIDSLGFAVPPGADRSRLHVSAAGLLSYLTGRTDGNAPVVFFLIDRAGVLQPLGNNGSAFVGLGSSNATPQLPGLKR
jgi:hypothetical protein